jgi:hypothetical protein
VKRQLIHLTLQNQMHLILAENFNGLGYVMLGCLVALLVSLVALAALVPASRGNRQATLAMAAPAFVIGVLLTLAMGYGFITAAMRDPDYELRDFAVPWLVIAGPPLGTSLLAVAVLWLRRAPAAR